MSIKFAARILSGVSTLAMASLATAQPNPPAAPEAANDIVVTGSRVITNGNNSPTPLTVVTMDDALRIRPSTVADALNDLPQFSGSRSPLGNPNTGSTVQQGGGNTGANSLNLRNLGQLRTLILFDGHRMAPTSATGLTDVDQIPQMMLQRVDVVTGGVSAVYGSDAVAGVVNFVTDRNFKGIRAKAQYGVNELGDDKSRNFGIAGGTMIGDRGHIEGSYEYRKNDGIDARSSRDPNHEAWSVQGQGTAAAPFFLTPNARVQSSTFGGLIRSGALTGLNFKQNGVATQFVHGTTTVPGSTTANEIGGDGVYYDTSLKAALESHQAFVRLDYDLSDNVHAYGEIAYNKKINTANVFWLNLNTVTLASANAFLAPTYQTQLAAASQTTFTFSKQLGDVFPQQTYNTSTMKYYNTGLEGKIGNYSWDFGVVHADAELIPTELHNTNNQNRAASLDAVVNPANGQTVCRVTLTNPGLYPGCVPLNPFGPTTDTLDAVNYIFQPSHLNVLTTLNDVTGGVSGEPFSTWAGPVRVALSGEYRSLSESVESTVPDGQLADCTGLRFNCVQGTTTLWGDTTAARPKVTQTVSEAAIEANVPLIKDFVLAQSVDLTGAFRYTNYSTKGTYYPWKLGLDWKVNDSLRLRGTRSRDIRAPTLDDLFSPTSSNVSNNTTLDRLTGQNVTGVINITKANPDLTAEVGNTWTGGVVYRPEFIRGFSLSIDYFNITVDNAILAILASNVTAQNACIASQGTSAYCAAQVRPLPYTNTTPANNLTALISTSINLSSQHTEGADIEANYTTTFLNRPASIRVLTTYQPKILYVQPGLLTLNQAGAAFGNNGITAAPIYRVTATARFMPLPNLTLDFQTRWRSALHESGDPTLVFSCCEIGTANFTNFAATYAAKTVPGQPEVSFNVANLFNQKGPHASPFTNTSPGQQYGYVVYDDPLGRAYTLSLRMRF